MAGHRSKDGRDIHLEIRIGNQGWFEIKSTKSRKTRYVRVSRTKMQVLLEHKKQLDDEKALFGSDYRPHDLVFPTPDGSYYSPIE